MKDRVFTEEAKYILARFHTEVLEKFLTGIPSFSFLSSKESFQVWIKDEVSQSFGIHPILISESENTDDDKNEEYFTCLQDFLNRYVRDFLSSYSNEKPYLKDLSHPFWIKRRVFINDIITDDKRD
ncbi:MAG: hypothetical protein H7Y38_14195 [Armatimonadetes bacterium]|nr:hypothetical protein [Armatimonadota bacterium]